MNWVDCGYNCHKVELIKGLLYIHLSWVQEGRKIGYKVNAGGRRLKNLFGDLPSAKYAGEIFAKNLLTEMQHTCK